MHFDNPYGIRIEAEAERKEFLDLCRFFVKKKKDFLKRGECMAFFKRSLVSFQTVSVKRTVYDFSS